MSEKKTDQAMRLFEAMEGVDPELLARSERTKKIIPFQRYASIAAACLVFFIAGSVMLVTLRNGGVHNKSASESAGNMAPNAQENSASINYENATKEASWEDRIEMEANQNINYENTEEMAAEADDYSGLEHQKEAVNGEMASATEKHYKSSLNIEAFLAGFGLTTRQNAQTTTIAISEENIAVTIGEKTVTCTGDTIVRLYYLLVAMELSEEADADAVWPSEDEIILRRLDANGVEAEGFAISGRYVKPLGGDEIYRILNEEYDYEMLREELERILQEETE